MVEDRGPIPCDVVIKEGGEEIGRREHPSRREAKGEAAVERDWREATGQKGVTVEVVPQRGRRGHRRRTNSG